MAAPLVSGVASRIFAAFQVPSRLSGIIQQDVRCASKKAGSTSKNKRKSTPGKHRGYKKVEDQHVEKGMILYKQLGLRCYPGENVGLGRDMTLFALERGKVVVSTEKVSPQPHSPLYPAVKAGRVVLKRYYNIIPEPQGDVFKLVSQS